MDSKRSCTHFDFLSKSQQVVLCGWQFIPNNRMPIEIGFTTSTWFSLRDWTEIQGRVSQYNHLYFSTFPHSQNPRSSHNATSIFFKTKPSSRIPKNITNELPHNHSRNLKHVHPLPCVGPYKNTSTILDLFLTFLK